MSLIFLLQSQKVTSKILEKYFVINFYQYSWLKEVAQKETTVLKRRFRSCLRSYTIYARQCPFGEDFVYSYLLSAGQFVNVVRRN